MNWYHCKYCGKTVNRNSEKAWIRSWCDLTGKNVRLMRIKQRTDQSLRALMAYELGYKEALVDAANAWSIMRRSNHTPDGEAWLRNRSETYPPSSPAFHKKVSSFGDDTCSCGFDGWPCEREKDNEQH